MVSDGCWLWSATITATGVGQFRVGRKLVQAHRHAWSLLFGTSPPSDLRHECGNLKCVRPDHMRPMQRRLGPTSLARPAHARFWNMVEMSPTCWLWRGSTSGGGYGQFRDSDMASDRPGRMLRAHRYAWILKNGPIPTGTALRSKCGTRTCVRPDHFTLGGSLPERRPTSRQLELLRRLQQLGSPRVSSKALAREFGIAEQTVRNELNDLRRRLDVHTTKAALKWLDQLVSGRAGEGAAGEVEPLDHL